MSGTPVACCHRISALVTTGAVLKQALQHPSMRRSTTSSRATCHRWPRSAVVRTADLRGYEFQLGSAGRRCHGEDRTRLLDHTVRLRNARRAWSNPEEHIVAHRYARSTMERAKAWPVSLPRGATRVLGRRRYLSSASMCEDVKLSLGTRPIAGPAQPPPLSRQNLSGTVAMRARRRSCSRVTSPLIRSAHRPKWDHRTGS